MSRVTLFLVYVAGMAVHAGAVAVQSAELPECDMRAKEEALVAGAIPDFAGCVAAEVERLVSRTRTDIRMYPPRRVAVAGIMPGMVMRQYAKGNVLVLSVSTRADYIPPIDQVAGTATPSPAPVGLDPAVVVSTPPSGIPDPGTSTPPAPPAEMPRFSISGSPRVIEGEPLIFQITREGDDSKPQRVIIEYYGGENFLVDPPESIEFPANQPSMSLELATAADPAQNGERRVDVQLEEVQGGRITESRSASVFIEDAAATPPETTAFSIRLDGVATRGRPIRFLVSRAGPPDPTEIVYVVTPGGQNDQEGDGARRILFGQDIRSLPIIVPPEDYDLCGEPVTITLQRGSVEETAKNVEFTEFTPPECREFPPPPTPLWEQLLNWLNTNVPWWPLIAAIVAAVALGTGIRRLVKPRPLPPVTAKCSIERGAGRLDLGHGSVGRWPPLKALVTIERGIGRAPNPLPIVERTDG